VGSTSLSLNLRIILVDTKGCCDGLCPTQFTDELTTISASQFVATTQQSQSSTTCSLQFGIVDMESNSLGDKLKGTALS
jgi:hypothetical protein